MRVRAARRARVVVVEDAVGVAAARQRRARCAAAPRRRAQRAVLGLDVGDEGLRREAGGAQPRAVGVGVQHDVARRGA